MEPKSVSQLSKGGSGGAPGRPKVAKSLLAAKSSRGTAEFDLLLGFVKVITVCTCKFPKILSKVE